MKAFIATIIFIIAAQMLYSQQTTPTRSDTIKLITSKWRITQITTGGKDKLVPGNKFLMQFGADGIMTGTADNNISKQKWKYDGHSHIILTFEKMTILKINSDSMVCRRTVQNEAMTVYMVKTN